MPRKARVGVRVVGALAAIGLAVPAMVVKESDQASAGTITSHAVINEIYANPTTGSEWVELYDPTTGPIGFAVCAVEDSDGNTTGSGCGHMTGDFALRWIDPPFLDDGGETLVLNGTGGVVDTVTYPALEPGESYARTYDGSTRWEIRSGSAVTPNSSNGEPVIDTSPPTLSVSNPIGGATYPGGFAATYSASDPESGVARIGFYLRDGASTGPYLFQSQDVNSAAAEPFASFEEFYSLAPGTYDLCVAAINEAGDGVAGAPNLTACDDAHPSVVAVDDIVVTDTTTAPADPTVTLTSPADGVTIADGTPTLTWNRSIDSGFLLIRQELTLSTSADFTQTPVTYTPSGTSFTLPDSFDGGDATWYWKVVLTYARSDTAPDEMVESDTWTFTVKRATTPPAEPRFEINGVDFDTYSYPGPGGTEVYPLSACTLTFETFGIGPDTAEVDIISEGPDGAVPLVERQPITSNHDPVGSNGTWELDLTDYASTALPSPGGYVLMVAIFTDSRSTMAGISRFSLPLDCLDDDGDVDEGDEDGGSEDGGAEDGGSEDGGFEDGGTEDGGTEDGGTEDGGSEDGDHDAGVDGNGTDGSGTEDGGTGADGTEDGTDGAGEDGTDDGADDGDGREVEGDAGDELPDTGPGIDAGTWLLLAALPLVGVALMGIGRRARRTEV